MKANEIKQIADTIRADRCTELAASLVEVPSLTGNEQPIAECMQRLLTEMNIGSVMQEFELGRYNTIGRINGTHCRFFTGAGGHCDRATHAHGSNGLGKAIA